MGFSRKRGVAAAALACALALAACADGSPAASAGGFDPGTTSGPAWSMPASALLAPFSADAASAGSPVIDASHASEGYVAASATSEARLKLQVASGDMSYNYVELHAVDLDVTLESEFAPFLRPNVFCDYDDASASTAKARELAADAANEGDVMRDVCTWVASSITYDYDKAAELSGTSGYVPDPDETLASGTGICFDYASLSAAMLRSLGIPCKIITGYVSPDGVYHAWNLVYADGSWTSVEFSVRAGEWSRVDLTFAAAGAGELVGDGTSYTDRYVY